MSEAPRIVTKTMGDPIEAELREQGIQLTPRKKEKKRKYVPWIVTCVIGAGIVLILFLASNRQQQPTAKEEADEHARLNRVENQNKALEVYHGYLKTRYPDWKLLGDDLNYDHIQRFHDTTFTAHITYDGIDKYVAIALRVFNHSDNGTQYWKAYEPSALDRLESLDKEKKQ